MPRPSENNASGRKVVATWRESLGDAGPYLGLGMQLGLIVAVYTLGGYMLDYWLDTLPWLTITGAGAGMVTMFIQLIRVTSEMNRQSTRRKQQRDREKDSS